MVCSVAGTMECSQCSPFCLKNLTVMNRVLPACRITLIDLYLGAKGKKVCHAANVVRVPMCEDSMRYRNRFRCEN